MGSRKPYKIPLEKNVKSRRLATGFQLTLSVTTALVVAACASRSESNRRGSGDVQLSPQTFISSIRLSYLAETSVAPDALAGGPRIGGLSGCTFDTLAAELLAVSDNRELPGIFRFRLAIAPDRVTLTPTRFDRLGDKRHAPAVLDLEGITLATRSDGRSEVVVSSEGDLRRANAVPPGLFAIEADALESIPVPAQFLARSDRAGDHGVRDNAAFESLTFAAAGRLWTANESALQQDGPRPRYGASGRVRLLEMTRDGNGWRGGRQFVYRLTDVDKPRHFDRDGFSTGLVDLLPLGPDRLLALERAFLQGGGRGRRSFNRVFIYDVSVAGAEDVSAVDALPAQVAKVAAKSLVVDFDALKPRLSGHLQQLENFEALCEGPRFADGGRSVLVVSDDNFNAHQTTAVLLFRLDVP